MTTPDDLTGWTLPPDTDTVARRSYAAYHRAAWLHAILVEHEATRADG